MDAGGRRAEATLHLPGNRTLVLPAGPLAFAAGWSLLGLCVCCFVPWPCALDVPPRRALWHPLWASFTTDRLQASLWDWMLGPSRVAVWSCMCGEQVGAVDSGSPELCPCPVACSCRGSFQHPPLHPKERACMAFVEAEH